MGRLLRHRALGGPCRRTRASARARWSLLALARRHGLDAGLVREPESPWRRSAAGYDTSDWALDVVADGVPGTDDWRVGFKDEDELYWYVAQGAFTPE